MGAARFSISRRLKIILSVVFVIAMFAALFWGLDYLGLFMKPINTAEAGELSITAKKSDKLGAAVDTSFLLTAQNPLDEKTVKEALKISPEFAYTLEKGSGGKEYTIVPKESLAANKVYTLVFDPSGQGRENYSWAFQTKGAFGVLGFLPADKSTHVPVDTGIEVVFSHEDFDLEQAKAYFSIEPSVEGRFEKHKRTLVFVPKGLTAGSVYQVTVKKGMPLSGGAAQLAADSSLTFETAAASEENKGFVFDMDTSMVEFAGGETPVFQTWFSGRNEAPPVDVSLYKYADEQAFIAALVKRDEIPPWSYYTAARYREDLGGLAKVADFQTKFISVDTYSHYVAFPEALPFGYYAADIKAGTTTRQVRFQVTDLATYLAGSEGKSLLWVNDLKTKAPATGVVVGVGAETQAAVGDKTGVAVINGNPGSYALVKSGVQEAVVPLANRDQLFYSEQNTAYEYWKYLYLDRELYQPGDTLHYWGVASARSGGAVGELKLELYGGASYRFFPRDEAPILTQAVKFAGKSYTGQIELPTLVPGYYYLRLKDGEKTLLSRGFTVERYRKPAYRLKAEPEKKAIFAGEGMNFLVKASFFEGTPVPSLSVQYHLNGKSGRAETNDKGEARVPYIGQAGNAYNMTTEYVYLGVNAELPEYGQIYAESNITVFASKVYLTGKAERSGDSFELEAALNSVDLSKINAGEYLLEENYVAGPVAGSLIKGKIYQDVWTKVEQGERYDFISKKVEKVYRYEYSAKYISDFSVITGEDGKASYGGKLDPAHSYYLELTAQDGEGRETTRRVPIFGFSRDGYYDYKYYHLAELDENKQYTPGDKVGLAFKENEQELAPKTNGFLYYLSQKSIESFTVSAEPRYGLTFEEKHIPNINVNAVCFDGSSYLQAMPYTAAYDRSNRALDVKVKADKEEYGPGDTVKLSVAVQDKDKKPVRAQVNLNLVDEALYSLYNQQTDLLAALYTDYIQPYITTRVSHLHPGNFPGGAEKGGEGGGERSDFRDTVLFATLETDKDGLAQTEFVLPDNLTSWRVTYHALTEELYAASGSTQIPVRLPFFMEMGLNDVCLIGDRPIVLLRAYGEKLRAGQAVSYKLKLVTPAGESSEANGQGSAFAAYDWTLPALSQVGKYSLTVEAAANGYSDKLTKEFTVAESLLERTLTQHELLSENLRLEGLGDITEPILLTFSDYERGQYLRGLYQLGWQNGGRFEQQAAAREAQELLAQFFPAEKGAGLEENITAEMLRKYQQSDGGIAILPYAESDLAVTVLAVSDNNSDVYDTGALRTYLYQQLDNAGAESAAGLALWGLASLGEPVLREINDRLGAKDLVPQEKIYLALASLEIGNGAYAGQVYRELLKGYGEDLGASLRIKAGRDQDEIIAATTQMAMLAARLDQPEKNKLYQYLLDNQGTDILNLLEQAQIVKYNLAYLQGDEVSFTYELNGEKVTKTLRDRETYQLTVLPADAAKLRFSAIEGKVGVVAAAVLPYRQGDITPQEGLSVSRSYYVGAAKTTTFGRSDLVRITMSYEIGEKAPGGNYEIVDILPAGLRYIERPYLPQQKISKDWRWPSLVSGQKITFNAGKGTGTISYYARVTAPGEYNAEPVLLHYTNSSKISVLSGRDRIIIK